MTRQEPSSCIVVLRKQPGITDPAELTKRTASAVLSRLTDSTAATPGTSAAHHLAGAGAGVGAVRLSLASRA